MQIGDPKILLVAFLAGVTPALLWLWFWLREDKKKEEPTGLLTMIFILGMVTVIFVIPIQKFIQKNIVSSELELIGFAAAEELIKYLAVIILVSRTPFVQKPLDWPIYIITAALGFAALENMIFLIQPFTLDESIVGLLTGQLRFLGSTLLHAVASGIIGISMGLSFFMHEGKRFWYLVGGIILAILLHSVFNFFIMKNNGDDFLKVYAFLWVVTIIIMLLFERLRKMS
jgi:RsiW-degrading membrane proteinase PrsW (M82 family)